MTPIRLSPIQAAAQQSGATMAAEAGWMMPGSFGDESGQWPAVGLVDESDGGKLLIDGRGGALAVAALGLSAPEAIGEGQSVGVLIVYRLRPDQLYLSIPPGGEVDAPAALIAADTGDERVTITDVTHGRAQLRLVGKASAVLLSRLCGLDFDSTRFPNRAARQTSVAKTTQLVIRDDLNEGETLSYVLVGPRSLGDFLWRMLMEAGHDLDVRPLGKSDIRAISR